MHIYIDESGLFKTATHDNAWCVVAAYVALESDIKHLRQTLTNLKLKCGRTFKDEIKLKDLSEDQYLYFLRALKDSKGTLYAAASDMNLLTDDDVKLHRDKQAEKIIEHKDKMLYESMKNSLQDLSDQVSKLSPQLYMQLVTQIILFADVLNRGILYYVQRNPKNLSCFKWRLDQKNTIKSKYEDALQKIAPALLQSQSIRRPSISLIEADYSAMKDFLYTKENAPTYLKDEYGIDINPEGAINLGKILSTDFKLCDSKLDYGVQVADLLASGLRRLLRGEFIKQREIAAQLGELMVRNIKGNLSINLISFKDAVVANEKTKETIKIIDSKSRNLVH